MGLSFITEWQPPRCGPWVAFCRTAVTERLKGSCNLIVEVSHKHACRHRSKGWACATITEKGGAQQGADAHPRPTHSLDQSQWQATDTYWLSNLCWGLQQCEGTTHTHTLLLTHQYQLYDTRLSGTRQTSGFFLVALHFELVALFSSQVKWIKRRKERESVN